MDYDDWKRHIASIEKQFDTARQLGDRDDVRDLETELQNAKAAAERAWHKEYG